MESSVDFTAHVNHNADRYQQQDYMADGPMRIETQFRVSWTRTSSVWY